MDIDKSKLTIKYKSENGHDIFELKYDGIPIGMISGSGNLSKSKKYFSEWVEIAGRYRQNGLATLLKKTQIKFAKENGFSKLETTVDFENFESLALQKKIGCKIYKGSENYLVYIDL